MLDRVDLNTSLDKETYRERIEPLTLQLRSLQEECRAANLPVVVVLDGWAAADKGKIVQHMLKHMDPRGFTVHSIVTPTPQERRYPWLWRFWQRLPGRGKTGIFYHSWYSHLLEDRLLQRISDKEFKSRVQEVNEFERLLASDGVVIAKFFIHVGRRELKKRLRAHEADPFEAWRVRPEDWQQVKHYQDYQAIAETMLAETDGLDAPWIVIAGNDKRWARIQVLKTMFDVISTALAEAHHRISLNHSRPTGFTADTLASLQRNDGDNSYLDNGVGGYGNGPKASKGRGGTPDFLAKVDLTEGLSRDRYKAELAKHQLRLRHLQLSLHEHNRAVLLLFEGWDAAGKGGAIKRLTDALDPRAYRVYPFAAPNDEARRHHYLWRFWQCLPSKGSIAIFDRTWYGRVLVERVERLTPKADWMRAYGEINALEEQLRRSQVIVAKFWLHIDADEQLRRFEERQSNPFKSHKITDEDWRNREKWSDYYQAVNEMLHQTNTEAVPWELVAANSKLHARIQILKTVIRAIEAGL
ncbi:MAG: polyphosphate:AMP phosphotransferase [Cyanobacteria bacterium P01_D01_bin.73]